jgi:hypothetical protein
MRRILLALIALALIAPASAQANECAGTVGEPWTGFWQVGSRTKNAEGNWVKETFGNIYFQVTPDKRTLPGTYQFSGGGWVVAQLTKKCGIRMSGVWADKSGAGDLEATLDTEKTFRGRFWPCRDRDCDSRFWWGGKVM